MLPFSSKTDSQSTPKSLFPSTIYPALDRSITPPSPSLPSPLPAVSIPTTSSPIKSNPGSTVQFELPPPLRSEVSSKSPPPYNAASNGGLPPHPLLLNDLPPHNLGLPPPPKPPKKNKPILSPPDCLRWCVECDAYEEEKQRLKVERLRRHKILVYNMQKEFHVRKMELLEKRMESQAQNDSPEGASGKQETPKKTRQVTLI